MDRAKHFMSGKICLVTGANSGIGKATALGLAQAGAHVVMVARDQTRGQQAQNEIQQQSGNHQVDLLLADLSSQQAVRQLAQEFGQRYSQLHVLVNNAGSFFVKRTLSVDGIEMTLALNHLASFLLTNLLLDTLRQTPAARVVNVSSGAQASGFINLDDLQMKQKYSMLRAYSQSKLANVLFTYALAQRLRNTDITVNCLHPGLVATNIWNRSLTAPAQPVSALALLLGISPEEGAQTPLYLATAPEVADMTGRYFDKCKPQRSATISYNVSVQERLWDESVRLTALHEQVATGNRL